MQFILDSLESPYMDFLFVLIELFFARCYGGEATSESIENRRFKGGGWWVFFGQIFRYRRGRQPATLHG